MSCCEWSSAPAAPAGSMKFRPRILLAVARPAANALASSLSRPRWLSAATSTSAYGVTKTGWPAVAEVSPASHSFAGWLAGLLSCPSQFLVPPNRYGAVMVCALASKAGSIAQVRCALAV